MKPLIACLLLCSLGSSLGQSQSKTQEIPSSKIAAPLSQEQGEEILNELRLIRKALEDRPARSSAATTLVQKSREATLSAERNQFALGSEHAPVTIVEFSDFQCPFCTQFNRTTFSQIKKVYIDTGKVRLVSREYPLEFHQNAFRAALAARCAGAQFRYWQMHDTIVENSSDLSDTGLMQDAQKSGLSVPELKTCLDKIETRTEVERDLSDGRSIGVTGTPAFLVGTTSGQVIKGIRLDGAQPYSEFVQAIETALKATQ